MFKYTASNNLQHYIEEIFCVMTSVSALFTIYPVPAGLQVPAPASARLSVWPRLEGSGRLLCSGREVTIDNRLELQPFVSSSNRDSSLYTCSDVCRCLGNCQCSYCPQSGGGDRGLTRSKVHNGHGTWKNICTGTRKISVHIYSGAQPPAHLRHRHDQVSEARQGLHLQPDQEGGGQHQDWLHQHPEVGGAISTIYQSHIYGLADSRWCHLTTTDQISTRMWKWRYSLQCK